MPDQPAWRTDDPRECVGRRADIVIVAIGDDAYLGSVATKHTWCIWTTHPFDRYKFIGADAEWPSHWVWLFAPTT